MLHVDTMKLLKLYLIQRYQKLTNYINDVILPQMKDNIPINLSQLSKVLIVDPLPEKKLF